MRKVFAGLFSSIDGVVEAPDQWSNSTLIKGSVADFVSTLRPIR